MTNFIISAITISLLLSCNPKSKPVEKVEPIVSDSIVNEPEKNFDSIKLEIQALIDSFANTKSFQTATVSFVLSNAKDSKTIASYNAKKNLIPASVIKSVTTASALEVLGPDFVFETKLAYSGTIDKETKTLNGNLYIIGGGDPALGSVYFQKHYSISSIYANWIKILKKLGINQINGSVIADAQIYDTEIVPTSWTWEDIGAYYGTAASGLSIYDNTFKVSFEVNQHGAYVPKQESIHPYIPGLVVENKIRSTENEFYLDILGAYYNDYRVIHGKVPEKRTKEHIKGSIPDPPFIAAYQLEQQLIKSGISVSGKATTVRRLINEKQYVEEERIEISSIKSPTLKEIVEVTNFESNNLFAEHLIKHIGYIKKNIGDDEYGAIAIYDFLVSKGIDITGLSLYDGCGISRKNLISAKQLVDLFNYMHEKSNNAEAFYLSLPVAGHSGTLKSFGDGSVIDGKLRAKSGSMTGVKSFAGYIETKDGSVYTFAIITNNFYIKSVNASKMIENLMIDISDLLNE